MFIDGFGVAIGVARGDYRINRVEGKRVQIDLRAADALLSNPFAFTTAKNAEPDPGLESPPAALRAVISP